MDSLIFELQIVLYFQLFLSANGRHKKHITINPMTNFNDDTLIILDNLVLRALFPCFGVGAPPPKPEKSALGTRLNFGKIFSCDSHVT